MFRTSPFLVPVLLAACATTAPETTQSPKPNAVNVAAREAIGREDALSQMAFWAKEYEAHRDDPEAARRFADVLRRGARPDRAVEVALEALGRHPADLDLTRTLGFSYLEIRKPQEALRPLAIVASADPRDWRSRTALGAALDQLSRYEEARLAYKEALAIKSDCVPALTNLGVSYLMSGEPENAEAVLRQAAVLPDAAPETRVNLAIALGLQGKFEDAERLQSVDLPPQMVAANMAHLRSLQGDTRRWDQLNGEGKPKAPEKTGQ